jgi:hypothetical protein
MNNIIIPYIIFVLLVLLISCVDTKTVSYSDAHHTENQALPIVEIDSSLDLQHTSKKYFRPVIWVRIASLKDRLLLENNIIENFRSKNINPVPGIEVFPPGKEISRGFIVPAFQKSGGDSLFIISLKPNSTLYHMSYDATLYDSNLHKTWVGHVVTKLQQTSSTHNKTDELVFEFTAHEIVNQIIKDGVILKDVN